MEIVLERAIIAIIVELINERVSHGGTQLTVSVSCETRDRRQLQEGRSYGEACTLKRFQRIHWYAIQCVNGFNHYHEDYYAQIAEERTSRCGNNRRDRMLTGDN